VNFGFTLSLDRGWVWGPWVTRVVSLLFGCFLVVAINWFWPSLFALADERLGAIAWNLHKVDTPERRIIIIDIDEKSIAAVGPWPWPREKLAELTDSIGALGAGVIIYDVVFPDSRQGDIALAESLSRNRVVLAQILALGGQVVESGFLRGSLQQPPCGDPIPNASGHIGNSRLLESTAGHITPRIDSDGAVRALPALICFDNKAYPALALAALVKASQAQEGWTLLRGLAPLSPHWSLVNSQIPGISIPVGSDGHIRVPYRLDRSALVSVSAHDVLMGKVPPELLRNAWAIVGATAFGIGDAVPTPQGGAVAGVEVHVQLMSAMLDGAIPFQPIGGPWGQALLLSVSMVILLLVSRVERARAFLLPVLGVLLAFSFLIAHVSLQVYTNFWLGWSESAAIVLLSTSLLTMTEHARSRMERRRLYRNLSSYLPAPVAQEVALTDPTDVIQAQRAEITVLYADIRNFSAYCENSSPEEAGSLLHAFFSAATHVVQSHEGIVEEFSGDAVLAVWNSPQQCADHARKALKAAEALQLRVAGLLPSQMREGLEPLALGVGIETGVALVGSFGPAERRTHTALGEPVTVAIRLQAMTADLAQPVLVGQGITRAIGGDGLTSLGAFLIEGLLKPQNVYAPLPKE